MSIARGLTKAVKAAKKQSRGLKGNRNSQGDFMPEDIQTKGVQDAVAPDIQNYINDVKSKIDGLDTKLEELYNAELQGADNASGDIMKQMESLKQEKFTLIEETLERLESEGIEPPEALLQMKEDLFRSEAEYSPDENQVMY